LRLITLSIPMLIVVLSMPGCALFQKGDNIPGKTEALQEKPVPTAQQKSDGEKAIRDINDWISALNRELENQEVIPIAVPPGNMMKSAAAASDFDRKEPVGKTVAARVKAGKSSAEKEEKEKEETGTEEADLKSLKVKVLSGDGEISSAQKMSKKLTRMGYTVPAVDKAPSSGFHGNTIFFAGDRNEAARQMAGRLGGRTVCKPLTWKSVYDLVVVTGK
jgi:hypothetical protein